MATSAQYATTPRTGVGIVTTADTSRTAPSTVVTVFTAGASGSRIDRIDLCAVGTTTATMVRLFIYNGSTYYLWKEVPVSAITPSSTVAVFATSFSSTIIGSQLPLTIPSGYSLRATINDTTGGVNVIANGGDF